MVVLTCDLSTWEAEAGDLQLSGLPRLPSETLLTPPFFLFHFEALGVTGV